MSRVKYLGGIGLLMVCANRHELVGSGAGEVVKRCALGPLGRPAGDKLDRPPLVGSEVPGQGPVTMGHVGVARPGHAASPTAIGACR
jgi:hypothetical protein